MLRSLRNRLILSHILPILLIIPLMGVAMVYLLETRLVLPTIYSDLSKDATLIAEITRNQPVFWQNGRAAQALVDGVSPYLSGQLSFVSTDGLVLAASEVADNGVGTQVVDLPYMAGLNQGETIDLQNGPLAETFTPVYDLNGHAIGIVRMTTQIVTVSGEIYQLRYLLGGVLLIGILAGVGLGSYLAFNINRPIQRVTGSIQALAKGDWQAQLEEQGPDEVRTLAQAVNILVDQLNSFEQSRRQLLANIVHELGRPLGAIRSAISAMLKGANKDPQLARDLLNGINGETVLLQHLLDDLAGLHKQVLGSLELNRVPVRLGEWLAVTLSPWEVTAREKGLVWNAKTPPDLPLIRIDPDRMTQALGNLLSNAVKFTPVGGEVSTGIDLNGDQLKIWVSDSGPGIPLDEQEKIFQPFFRGSQNRRIVQGMGLGLSIARDIIRAHGGEIELENTPGDGGRFVIRMQVEVPEEAGISKDLNVYTLRQP